MTKKIYISPELTVIPLRAEGALLGGSITDLNGNSIGVDFGGGSADPDLPPLAPGLDLHIGPDLPFNF